MEKFLVLLAWITTCVSFFNAMLFFSFFGLIIRSQKKDYSFLKWLTLCISLNQLWFGICRVMILTGIIKGQAAQGYFSPAFFIITFFGIYLYSQFEK